MRNDSIILEELTDQELDMVNGGGSGWDSVWSSIGKGVREGASNKCYIAVRGGGCYISVR
ncbi:type A2 lanthipeptide [Rothia dentocariosa]|uniref:type A2 lanthipeptide n=1 Tax=Rothia dentocariosa TaxID=2047 RepID=UPI0028E80943|nr:type A2 lanthipeptide [Rothia dentocariosa]